MYESCGSGQVKAVGKWQWLDLLGVRDFFFFYYCCVNVLAIMQNKNIS